MAGSRDISLVLTELFPRREEEGTMRGWRRVSSQPSLMLERRRSSQAPPSLMFKRWGEANRHLRSSEELWSWHFRQIFTVSLPEWLRCVLVRFDSIRLRQNPSIVNALFWNDLRITHPGEGRTDDLRRQEEESDLTSESSREHKLHDNHALEIQARWRKLNKALWRGQIPYPERGGTKDLYGRERAQPTQKVYLNGSS